MVRRSRIVKANWAIRFIVQSIGESCLTDHDPKERLIVIFDKALLGEGSSATIPERAEFINNK